MRSDARSGGWPTAQLGSICAEVQYGYTASADDKPVGPRFLRITDIVSDQVDWASVPHCEASSQDGLKYALRPGDIVIARTGASAGASHYCQPPEPAVFASYLVRFRTDPTKADPRYVSYVLRSPSWRHYVRGASGGSAQPQLNARVMSAFSFPLPPLPEQARIASVLGAVDDKIASNRLLAGHLEEIAATLFRARFVDFVGIEEFEESEIGRIPRGWSLGTLSQLVQVTMGQSPPGATYTEDPSGGMLLVQGMGGFGDRYPVTDVYTSAPTKQARPGATLMTVRAPVGAVNVARTELCVGRGVAAIDSAYQAFTEFLVRSLKDRWAEQESGTIFPAVNRQQVLGLRVVVPPQAVIAEFESTAAAIVAKLAALHDEAETLASLRDTLLPKLISGQIRVPDTADAAEVIEPALA